MICETWELAVLALVAFLAGVVAAAAFFFAWAACAAKREGDRQAKEMIEAAQRDLKPFALSYFRGASKGARP